MDRDSLRSLLLQSFAAFPRPEDNRIALHECEECARIRMDYSGKTPESLSSEVIEFHHASLPMLSPEAFRYFVVALMLYSLELPESEVAQFTLYSLAPSDFGGDDFYRVRFEGFASGQKEASHHGYEAGDLQRRARHVVNEHTTSLVLQTRTRPGEVLGSGVKAERSFLDLVVGGLSFYDALGSRGYDFVSCLGWGATIDEEARSRLLMRQPGDLPSGRTSLFICPECGDLGCGCVSAQMVREGDRIVWLNLSYENNYEDKVLRPLRTRRSGG